MLYCTLDLFRLSCSHFFLGLKNAFKVLLFPETHVYQADNKQLKVIILYLKSTRKFTSLTLKPVKQNGDARGNDQSWWRKWDHLWRNDWVKELRQGNRLHHVTVHIVKTKLNTGDCAFSWSIPFNSLILYLW